MKKILAILIISFLALSAGEKSNDQKLDTNAKIKAVYIYNFTKYIEWPEEYQMQEFVVGILGNDEALFNELEKMAKVKKVGNRKFSIVHFSQVSAIDRCNILFIPFDKTSWLPSVVSKLRSKSTVIITEKPGMILQGASINFVIESNKQKFELNKTNLARNNINVSEALEQMAIAIN